MTREICEYKKPSMFHMFHMFSFKLITRYYTHTPPPAKMTGNCCQALWLFPGTGWEFNFYFLGLAGNLIFVLF